MSKTEKEPLPKPNDWNPSTNPGHLLNRATRLLARLSDSRLRRLGFGVGQLPVLVSLKNGAALSQKDLAQIAQIEQPSMAQMLTRMERDGLIQRVPDPKDRRSSHIMLTDLAQERFPEGRAILLQGHKEALTGFSDVEKETLTALLQRIVANLETTLEEKEANSASEEAE